MRTIKFSLKGLLTLLVMLLQIQVFAQGGYQSFTSSHNDMDVSYDESTGEYTFTTTGGDPYIRTQALASAMPKDSCIISFEYNCPSGLQGVQFFFAAPESEALSMRDIVLQATRADEWLVYQLDVSDYRTANGWGVAGDYLRMDLGYYAGTTIKIRNLRFGARYEGKTFEDYMENVPYTPDDIVVGKICGTVGSQQAYNDFYEAYNEAIDMLDNTSASQDEIDAMFAKIKQAYADIDTAFIKVTDGTYYIKSNFSEYTNREDTMAWYAPRIAGYPGWKKYEPSLKFMWHITPLENGNFSIRNLATGQYVYQCETPDGQDSPLMLSEKQLVSQVIARNNYLGSYQIHSDGQSWVYNLQGNSSASASEGPIANWSDKAADGEGSWMLEPVSDADLAKAEAAKSRDELNVAITQYEGLTNGAVVGPELGKPHSQEQVTEVENAIAAAVEVEANENATDAEIRAALEKLTAVAEKFNAEVATIPNGYYRLRSAYNLFAGNLNDLYLANYGDSLPGWNYYQKSVDQLWYIENLDSGYSVKNVKTGKYLSKSNYTTNNSPVQCTREQEVLQMFKLIKPNGQWKFYNEKIENYGYYPYNHQLGLNFTGGRIAIYKEQGENGTTAWFIEPVAEAEAQTIINNEENNQLNIKLQQVYEKARALYNAGAVYTTGSAIVTSKDQLYANNWSPSEGANLETLIDGNTGSYWCSTWEGASSEQDPTNPHYMRVYSEAGLPDSVQVSYLQRQDASWHRMPLKLRVEVSNDATTWTNAGVYQKADLTKNGELTPGTLYNEPITFVATGLGGYKYVRFINQANYNVSDVYIVGTNHYMLEFAEFNLYPITGVTSDCLVKKVWNASLAPELFNALQEAKPQYVNGTATQATYDRLLAAYNAYYEENNGANEIDGVYQKYQSLIPNCEVGSEFGYVESQGDIDTFEETIDALYSDFTSDNPSKGPGSVLKAMQAAYDEFMTHVEQPQPGKWYYILSATAENDAASANYYPARAQVRGTALYTLGDGKGEREFNYAATHQLRWGMDDIKNREREGDPDAIWQFIPTPDSLGYGARSYFIQNMRTGWYMGGVNSTSDFYTVTTKKPQYPYSVEFIGSGQFNLKALNGSRKGQIISFGENARQVRLDAVASAFDSRSSLTFEEFDAEEEGQITLRFDNNWAGIVTLPFAITDIDQMNDNVHAYKIHSIDEDMRTIGLVEAYEFEAGEPFIMVVNDTTQYSADADQIGVNFPAPTELVTDSMVVNGLVSVPTYKTILGQGFGYFDGNVLLATDSNSVGINSQSGYIDPSMIVNQEGEPDCVIELFGEGLLNGVKAAAVRKNETVSVYTTDGAIVKRNVKSANATNGLRKGLYIVGKKKVLVK